MTVLTARQSEIAQFIRGYFDENLFPPTLREIAAHFGVSVKSIQDHVAALQKKGVLAPTEGKSRSLRIISAQTDEGREAVPFVKIPLFGNVAAGAPITTFEESDESLFLPQSMLKAAKRFFALKVRGDSMTGAGIFSGDIAIVEKTAAADNGEIVVAVLDDAITLKRFFREATRVRLEAENPAYPPIYCTNVRIAGRLSKIIRNY